MPKALDDGSPDSGPNPREAFICVSNKLGVEWTAEANRIVTELGMVPFFYQGLESQYRGSVTSNEAETEMWDCDVIILAITSEEANQPERLWIYNELEVARRRGVAIFIYVHVAETKLGSEETIEDLGNGSPVSNVMDRDDFARRLRSDLKGLAPG